MLNKLAFAATAAVAMLGVTSKAHATPTWHLSPEIGYINGYCNPATNIGMTTRVGYYGETVPHTGDNPDSAVVIKVTAGCGAVTAVPDFRLPPQVRRDTSFPIECARVRANGGPREVLQNDMHGACSQVPLQNPWNLPNVFAWAGLAAGESLEVYMPIEYISVATPATPASFSAEVRHSIQLSDPLFPIIQFSVAYAARFKNYAFTNQGRGRGPRFGSWDGERVDISFALYHYFQSGDLVIDYGTTPSLGSNLGTSTVPNGGEYYPNVTASFTGLAENTQYYWRPKYITAYGTFYGETQTFRTYAYFSPPGNGPVITTQPASQTIPSGSSATMNVVATGTTPLSYQWYQGVSGDTSAPIAGATAASYTTPALTAPTNVWVRVSNSYGSAASATATVSLGVAVSGTMRTTDFNGDGEADIAVWRPSTGVWWILQSDGHTTGTQWGALGDVPVAGDYDGDHKTDIAVWRPSTGVWWVIKSSDGLIRGQQWGADTDIPVAGDYDGDLKTDIAIWRPSTGVWWIIKSSDGLVTSQQWGANGDIPVTGDYDGDGKTDVAVYRPSDGVWYILKSTTNFTGYAAYQSGESTDTLVPDDYDGDGKTDIAVYRPATGAWYILKSSTNFTTYAGYQWGVSTDTPVPGDYDGDGKSDIAVFRPTTGAWHILKSSTNFTTYASHQWGVSTDVPVLKRP